MGLRFFSVLAIAGVLLFFVRGFKQNSTAVVRPDGARYPISRVTVAQTVGGAVKLNAFPTQLDLPVRNASVPTEVRYALNATGQAHVQKLFETYKPDYGAFVAMDAQTGRILALASYTRGDPYLGNLALRAIFPSASVFKVITATAAIDAHSVSPETVIPFNGRPHTLYRTNIEQNNVNRFTRYMTLREAFGKSVNTVFGKLGVFYIGPHSLREYAARFKFNNTVPSDLPFEQAMAEIPTDDSFGVAQAASGFTQNSKMSPVQGALIAAAIANDGVMMAPYLVDSIHERNTGELLYQHDVQKLSVTMSPTSASELRVLMRETVQRGTSRKSFRQLLKSSRFSSVEFGGKTGSLTGTDPKGKCDWFVGYARTPQGQKIAVSALTIHEKLWRVKSSQLAVSYFETLLREMQQGPRQMASTGDPVPAILPEMDDSSEEESGTGDSGAQNAAQATR